MRLKRLTFVSILLLVMTSAATAAECGSRKATNATSATRVLAVRVAGKVMANGQQFQLIAEFGPVATRAVRVYSEPSDTLLLVVIDPKFKASPEGQGWLASTKSKNPPSAVITSSLPGAKPTVQIPARPKDDTRITVWINGDWPLVGEQDRLISDGTVGNGNFGFSTLIESAPTTIGEALDPTHCCEGGNCPQM